MRDRASRVPRVKMYRVGGSVRDEIIGRDVVDRDWVVVGATPEILLASGYRPVGKDFPVFLHPDTHEEYALARTEKKHGRGYRGFEFFASPDVTLEEDLRRRDLTINAMARDQDGSLIDPFGGERDLAAGVLRHVSPAFAEDPLRVLRVARFAARFGFVVAPETEALMRALVSSGEIKELSPERVWQELARGLMEPQPSRMLAVLRACGALAEILPEVDALYGVPQPPAHHPELDTGVHVAMALDYSAREAYPLAVRYAVLVHDLGKAGSPIHNWPKHHAHEARSVRLAAALSQRLRVPVDCRDAGRLAARWHGVVQQALILRPATLLDLFTEADAWRRPERLQGLLQVCTADACSRPDRDAYPPATYLREAFAIVKSIDAGAVARGVLSHISDAGTQRLDAKAQRPNAIAAAIRRARLQALRNWIRIRRNADLQQSEKS